MISFFVIKVHFQHQASPKPRTEQWVQQHMNNQMVSSDEEIEQQKLNDDYQKRKHLYE